VRTSQSDLNNPLSGGVTPPFADGPTGFHGLTSPAYSNYTSLGLGTCVRGAYTVTGGGARGTGCQYNLVDLYNQIRPKQERYSSTAALSFRFNDNVEGYLTGSFSHDFVSIKNSPAPCAAPSRSAAASLASTNPGIVLPVYICTSGVNCADGRRRPSPEPEQPLRRRLRRRSGERRGRIYYLFGDIPAGSDRTNEVYPRHGGPEGRHRRRLELARRAVGARTNWNIEQYGFLNIANLLKSINTGSYNFVNPGAEHPGRPRLRLADRHHAVAPRRCIRSTASITKTLWDLPGGDMQLAVGGQIREEELVNNNQNAKLDTYTLTTSSAFGKHTVSAGYLRNPGAGARQPRDQRLGPLRPLFGRLQPLLAEGRRQVHADPATGASAAPTRKGFRAPTFAEAGPRSQYAGFSTYTAAAILVPELAHGGTICAPTMQHQPLRQA
jgi:iron complex outermembrane receptor protein